MDPRRKQWISGVLEIGQTRHCWRTCSSMSPSGQSVHLWQPGYELSIQGLGGVINREKRKYTIVGHGWYANHVGGHRTLTAGSQDNRCGERQTVQIARSKDTGDLKTSWGVDALTVKGDADVEYHSKTLMMTGTINRLWNGGVVRMAAMEGIICGGSFVRVIASPSGTMSGLMSGDIYGGCARVSVARTYIALLHYRAAQVAVWATGAYVRNTTFTIEPIIGSPSSVTPKGDSGAKMARLARIASAARMVCPLLDIAAGIISIPPAIAGGIFNLAKKATRKPNPIPPPSGPPRIRTRVTGITSMMYTSMTHL